MNKKKIFLLLIFFLIIYYLFTRCFCIDYKEMFLNHQDTLLHQVNINDNIFYNKMKNRKLSYLVDNNLLKTPTNKKNNILFITFDNRKITSNEYIQTHNDNITNYCKKWNYKYKYITECKYNVYWCKIYLVLEQLLTNNYDYVVWLDSDTFIFNKEFDISTILNSYSSEIFIASDNMKVHDMINAGVFIIKNSEIGIKFLKDCIKNFDNKLCITENNKLRGIWAASCYEQGVMNTLIYDTYYKYTTVIPNDLILNSINCDNKTFIMHLYSSTNDKRIKCFNSKN